jgi:hypothetical protein
MFPVTRGRARPSTRRELRARVNIQPRRGIIGPPWCLTCACGGAPGGCSPTLPFQGACHLGSLLFCSRIHSRSVPALMTSDTHARSSVTASFNKQEREGPFATQARQSPTMRLEIRALPKRSEGLRPGIHSINMHTYRERQSLVLVLRRIWNTCGLLSRPDSPG